MKSLSLFALAASMNLAVAAIPATAAPADFLTWAPNPPMGWNSWDNFATTVTEDQTQAQADYMAAHLKAHGWQYIIVDIQWYEPGAKSHAYRPDAKLVMDAYGRLQPAANRFPSAADGSGFTALAAYVHHLGLKFGVHLMRGIPRQAVEQNLPVFGTDGIRAADIADTASICPWNPDMYGVDMTKPGAQAYYDSVFSLFASWGIDYVKVDDISRPYHEHQAEIEAIRTAIDQTGRPIVLSLSPGATALSAAEHVATHANLWRISDDFWDRWLSLREQFTRLAAWNPHRRPGAWPDADMLPFGTLVLGERTTRFTPDEQRTVMTLWSIARSPLMHGGDLTKTDDFTLSLLTNDEVLAVNQTSTHNRPVFEDDDFIVWTADVPDSPTGDKYLAVFNTRDRIRSNAAHATFVGPTLSAGGDGATAIDVDVSGGRELILTLETPTDGNGFDHGRWNHPTLHFADGTTRPLPAELWTLADSMWDGAQVRKNEAGDPVALTAQAPARIVYDLPAGAIRFTADAVIDAAPAHATGTARFLVTVGRADNTDTSPGLAVPVDLTTLGLTGPVQVRDLWTHTELGTSQGTFAPVVPFHGAGLYRLTPTSAVVRP